MTDFASIAERLAQYPVGAAHDPHTRDDAIDALREAGQINGALVAALAECVALMRADNPADGWADAIAAGEDALAQGSPS